MVSFNREELMGLFENLDDNKDKADMLKEQIKMVNKDSTDQIKAFAQDREVSPQDLKDAYKYYVKRQREGEEVNEDYFTLCALIDLESEEE